MLTRAGMGCHARAVLLLVMVWCHGYLYPCPQKPVPLSAGVVFTWVWVWVDPNLPMGYPWRALFIGYYQWFCLHSFVLADWKAPSNSGQLDRRWNGWYHWIRWGWSLCLPEQWQGWFHPTTKVVNSFGINSGWQVNKNSRFITDLMATSLGLVMLMSTFRSTTVMAPSGKASWSSMTSVGQHLRFVVDLKVMDVRTSLDLDQQVFFVSFNNRWPNPKACWFFWAWQRDRTVPYVTNLPKMQPQLAFRFCDGFLQQHELAAIKKRTTSDTLLDSVRQQVHVGAKLSVYLNHTSGKWVVTESHLKYLK